MTDEEYVRQLGQLYDAVMRTRRDEDYEVNPPQMAKLAEILEFFTNIARKHRGRVIPPQLHPREEHGGFDAKFTVFDIYGEDIQRFCKVIGYASALSIDAEGDGVCLSVTIPEVFVPKKSEM